ncbi:MAG: GNAT family N-acetyltransferase [Desulfovibrio sp.]|jgi:ribosomal-protein-alanine N-acetyltransferase|nr:GNAT family N-acetyltransferase [Desulfovibrio sp.]
MIPCLQKIFNPLYWHAMRLPDEHSIERLTRKDAEALSSLEAECFSTCFSPEQYAVILDAGENAPLRAFGLFGPDGGGKSLVAYVSFALHPAAGEVEIYNIATRAGHRRRGCAEELLKLVLSAAAALNLKKALLEVRSGNAPALALYKALGFTLTGRRKGYYAQSGEDALLLERALCGLCPERATSARFNPQPSTGNRMDAVSCANSHRTAKEV